MWLYEFIYWFNMNCLILNLIELVRNSKIDLNILWNGIVIEII